MVFCTLIVGLLNLLSICMLVYPRPWKMVEKSFWLKFVLESITLFSIFAAVCDAAAQALGNIAQPSRRATERQMSISQQQ